MSIQPIGAADLGLTDCVALVTAGANGIGEGAAISLARFGCDVAVADIDQQNGERVCEAIRAGGREALFIAMNAMDAEQVQAAVAATVARFGRLDVLVNNAGGVKPRPLVDQTESNWRRIIDLNLVSMVAATQAASKVMIQAGRGGAIINVASSEALRAAPNYSVYGACKAGMTEFTKTMALELGEHNIRVNCIAPDGISTPGVRAPGTPPSVGAGHIPLRRWAPFEEAGLPIAFLASKLASYVTGATLSVDGGIAAAGGWVRMPNGGWGFGV
jgi:NAD(P)-dependent dehydrogenase (short-subunit alcohol dehydrogenase family)